MSLKRHAFLLATQNISERVIKNYSDIQTATCTLGETFILYHKKHNDLPAYLKGVNNHIFTDSILFDLNYIPLQNTLIPGSNHFSLLDFFLRNPDFEYYWYIEYDVVFNGKWERFFKEVCHFDIDFISSYLALYKSKPLWHWWDTLQHPNKSIPLDNRISSFNPIYRISFQALSFIHDALLNKWSGHHEVLLPTLIYNNKFKVMDFGGTGTFVPPGNYERFYTQETFRWRPSFEKIGSRSDKLYHPVKSDFIQ